MIIHQELHIKNLSFNASKKEALQEQQEILRSSQLHGQKIAEGLTAVQLFTLCT
jgi:hypothetical protein